MKRCIKLPVAALLCGLLGLTGPIANAQSNGANAPTGTQQTVGQKHPGGHKLAQLAAALGLSDSQKGQIKTLLKNAKEQRKAIRANAQLSAADKKAKLKALGKSTRSQVAAILTPEQKAKWRQMHKGNRAATHA